MIFIIELLQFVVLIPAAILALIPLKNQLRYSIPKVAGLVALTLGCLIPFCGLIVAKTGTPVNYILSPCYRLSGTSRRQAFRSLSACLCMAGGIQLFVFTSLCLVFSSYSWIPGRQYLFFLGLACHHPHSADFYLYECAVAAPLL